MEIRKEKDMKKKMIALLLACTLAVGMVVCPVGPGGMETVWADDEAEVTSGDWKYESDGADGIIITGYTGSKTELTKEDFPTIEGKTVTGIGDRAFWYCESLISIEMPDSVTSIGIEAFENCSSLTGIKLSNGLTSIGRYAFDNCSSLTSIEIPASVTSIADENPFIDCIKLESITVETGNPNYVSDGGVVYNKDKTTLILCPAGKKVATIPSSVNSIGRFAFYRCSNLTSLELPDGLTSIGWYAFRSCSSLTGIEIPDGVTSIDISTFEGCSSLASVKLPNGLTSISKAAFKGCSSLANIEIPASVTSMAERWEEGAFEDCSSLTSIKIPDGVPGIGMDAFANCSSLTSIEIPASVTFIKLHAFEACDNLKDIYYGGTQEQWNAIQIDNKAGLSESVRIHFNSSAGESGNGQNNGQNNNQNSNQNSNQNNNQNKDQAGSQKSDQVITAKNITKTYGAKAFSLNARVNTKTTLTYVSSNKKVAIIDKKGKITIKGCGITNITITAPATDTCNQAKKTIKLTVKPKKVSLSSVKSTKKKTATVKWKQDKKATGYLIQCATDSKFKKNKVQVTVGKNKTVSTAVKKLKAGKKYYVRVCAYAKSGKTKVQGDWSKVKTVKVKK